MEQTIPKVKKTVSDAPIGAVLGALSGYILAKQLGFEKTFSVVSFALVFTIIGASLGSGIKKTV